MTEAPADRIYRALLRFFPARFRHQSGEEMVRLFRDQRREVHGAWSLLRLWLAVTRDAVTNGLRERMGRPVGGERRPSPKRRPQAGPFGEDAAQDVRYALRSFRRSPAFTLVAVATLALGIGANTAIFSIVSGVLLRPLGYRNPERLVQLVGTTERDPSSTGGWLNYQDFRDWTDAPEIFAGAAASQDVAGTLTGGDEPRLVKVAVVSASFFDVLGVSFALGRGFVAEEGRMGGNDVVVLGDGLWRRAFGANPDIVGSSVELNGRTLNVVGVLAPGFEDPWLDRRSARRPEAWVPFGWSDAPPDALPARGSHSQLAIGRLQPGVSIPQAQAVLDATTRRLQEAYPLANAGEGVRAVPLGERIVGDARASLMVLLGAVALVLAIATANVASLVLSRAADRGGEMALRAALGATRGRLARQLLAEGVLLAAMGCALGIAVAVAATRLFVALIDQNIPRADGIGIDPRVAGFTVVLTVIVGVMCGLTPALQRPQVDSRMGAGRGTTGGRRGLRTRNALVVVEVALTIPLLVGAGLLIKTFTALNEVEVGLDPRGVITFQLNPPRRFYPDRERITPLYREIVTRIGALPGVRGVAGANVVPLSGGSTCSAAYPDDQPRPAPGTNVCPENRAVTPDYFRVMAMSLGAGREFAESDDAEAPPVIVINETLARTFWPDQDPLGKRVTFLGVSREVVGVLRDVKHQFLDQPTPPETYTPHAQEIGTWLTRSLTMVVRTDSPPETIMPAVRRAVWAVDGDLSVAEVRTMDEIVAASLTRPRFRTTLLASFAGTALLLAAVGIYGLVSFATSLRSREMAIRVALGARGSGVRNLIVRQGLTLAAMGSLLGVAGALALTRLLRGLLFGVTATDITVFAAGAATLLVVAGLASYLPARRATRVDAMSVLRQE